MKLIFLCFLLFGSGTCGIFDLIITRVVPQLWVSEPMELFGYNCNFNRVPSFKRFELYHKASVSCPGWAPFAGKGESRNPQLAVQIATQQFIRKAFERNLITKEDASIWLGDL